MISSAEGVNRAHVSIFILQVKKNMDVTRSRVGRLTNDEQMCLFSIWEYNRQDAVELNAFLISWKNW